MKDNNNDRKEYLRKYYMEHKEEISAKRKAARLARRDEINAQERELYANDPKIREQRLKIAAKSRQKQKAILDDATETQLKHQERLAKRRARHKERLANDPEYRKKVETYNKNKKAKKETPTE